jgi:NifB/MoaA-like Fe-S oxidoreductase
MAKEIENKNPKIKIDVYKIKNNFFGESITVSGLLTGTDIYEQLNGRLTCDELLLPSCCVRASDEDFLCGMKLDELSFVHRTALKSLKKIMSSKENPSEMEKMLVDLCDADGDFSDKASIEPLLKYIKE